MSQIQITIAEPANDAAEIADDTRVALQDWVNSVQDQLTSPVEPPLDQDHIRALRTEGSAAFHRELEMVTAVYELSPGTGRLLILALNRAEHSCASSSFYASNIQRSRSYALEGAAAEFNKQWFAAGLKWTDELKTFNAALVCHSETNVEVSSSDRALIIGEPRNARNSLGYSVNELELDYSDVQCSDSEGRAAATLLINKQEQEVYRHCLPSRYVGYYIRLTLAYMDCGEPWIAGYLSHSDALVNRWSRVRLGAFLTAQKTWNDTWVRDAVERAKRGQAAGSFVIVPNDGDWADVYERGPQSCMSGSAHGWDDYAFTTPWGTAAHPVDAYSSARLGCGDNGMALFTSVNEHGSITGRGIWRNGNIVRWYGDHAAGRALKRLGIETDGYGALEGSWLGLIPSECGKYFRHPYVDGGNFGGFVDGQRVYLNGGNIDLQDTTGYSRIGSRVGGWDGKLPRYLIDEGRCNAACCAPERAEDYNSLQEWADDNGIVLK